MCWCALLRMPLFICLTEANWHLESLTIKKLSIPSVIFTKSPILFRSYSKKKIKEKKMRCVFFQVDSINRMKK